MVYKNSFFYKLLEDFYLLRKNLISPSLNEVRFELIDNDIDYVDVKENRFFLYLSRDGLVRIKKKINYRGAIPLVILYVNEERKLLKLVTCENLKDILYNDVLIWHPLNSEDLKLQRSFLGKFISSCI